MKKCLLALGFWSLAGCTAPPERPNGGKDEPDAGAPCFIGLEMGQVADESFLPFQDDQMVDVVLGFQGFRFIEGAARITGTDAEFVSFRFHVTFQDHSPIVQDRIAFMTSLPTGARLAENVQIFFNDIPMTELLDEHPRLDATATAGNCTGKQTLSLRLGDGGTCDDLTEGGTLFPDGGGPCADAGL
ncbi:MAG: hypothetical protein IPM54_36415 [Polyangiaceae bacterium]|nr:hypothetical protein [Polyangiaceae bacterium]